jgi:hypothetical protein
MRPSFTPKIHTESTPLMPKPSIGQFHPPPAPYNVLPLILQLKATETHFLRAVAGVTLRSEGIILGVMQQKGVEGPPLLLVVFTVTNFFYYYTSHLVGRSWHNSTGVLLPGCVHLDLHYRHDDFRHILCHLHILPGRSWRQTALHRPKESSGGRRLHIRLVEQACAELHFWGTLPCFFVQAASKKVKIKMVKISLLKAVEAPRVARG